MTSSGNPFFLPFLTFRAFFMKAPLRMSSEKRVNLVPRVSLAGGRERRLGGSSIG